jgi:hypothetical protein
LYRRRSLSREYFVVAQGQNCSGSDGQWQAFTPAVILFIALPEADDKTDPG